MNLLPRLLALALLLVLVALAVVLAGPLVRRPATTESTTSQVHTAAHPPSAKFATLSSRIAFPLALSSVVLALALVVSLARRRAAPAETRPPFATSRTEVAALAKLAESSNAQSAALAHERSVRQRAEADALLNQQLLTRSLEEKIRLGRDLHDGIIQSLYAAGLTIESARAVAANDPAEADRRLARCLETLNGSIRSIRAYIAGLAPANLRQSGFAAALTALAEELRAGRIVRFDVRIDEEAVTRLSDEQTTEALQIAREAISNGLRHGEPTLVTVRLHPGEDEVCLLVQDDGRGFTPSERGAAGHGLSNMEARARRMGGELRIESAAGKGTRVVFNLPINRA